MQTCRRLGGNEHVVASAGADAWASCAPFSAVLDAHTKRTAFLACVVHGAGVYRQRRPVHEERARTTGKPSLPGSSLFHFAEEVEAHDCVQ